MSLQNRLNRIREGFQSQAPGEALAVMQRITKDLNSSGIVERSIGEGQAAALSFNLEDSRGGLVNLEGALKHGPVLLTFFRGNW